MKITVNDKNEVIGYVNTGGLRNSLDVDDNNVPIKFKEEFEPRKFVFTNGEIKYNSNFEKEDVPNASNQQSASDLSDEELRGMVCEYANAGGTSKCINDGISSTKRYVNTTVD